MPLLEKIPRVANHKTATIPTYSSIYAQVDSYTEKIGIVYETVNTDNWGRAVAYTSIKVLKDVKPQIMQEWGVDFFPMGIYCDFGRLHHTITGKRLNEAQADTIKMKMKCDRAGLKSDADRCAFDFFRAIKTFNLKVLRQVLKLVKSSHGNTNFSQRSIQYHKKSKTYKNNYFFQYKTSYALDYAKNTTSSPTS